MARSGAIDPLDKFRWLVEIDGFTRAGFKTAGTPSYSTNTKEYKEGGAHLNPKRIVDGVSYEPITLTRGVTNDTSFSKWASGFIDLVQNNTALEESSFEKFKEKGVAGQVSTLAEEIDKSNGGAVQVPSNSGNLSKFQYRRNVTIQHINRAGQPEVVYILYNAFPIDYKPASDFDAESDGEVSMESITLAYEGFDVRYTGISGTLGNFFIQEL